VVVDGIVGGCRRTGGLRGGRRGGRCEIGWGDVGRGGGLTILGGHRWIGMGGVHGGRGDLAGKEGLLVMGVGPWGKVVLLTSRLGSFRGEIVEDDRNCLNSVSREVRLIGVDHRHTRVEFRREQKAFQMYFVEFQEQYQVQTPRGHQSSKSRWNR
jgi:hypothetical protein